MLLCREKLACELLLIQQTMEIMLHVLGVKEEEDLGDLRLPFAVAVHLSPDGCRFVALSPDANERGLRPCVCLARVPWSDSTRILTGLAHIVVRLHSPDNSALAHRTLIRNGASASGQLLALPLPCIASPARFLNLRSSWMF
jgi:hypothetical protein